MDLLQLEALEIRHDAIRPMLLNKEIDGWTALAMVVAPSEDLRRASLVAAQKLQKKAGRIRVPRRVVTIDDLAAL